MSNNYDLNNVFAKILSNDISCKKVLENEHALAFLDINPQAPTHILIIPKNPFIDFYDFSNNSSQDEMINFWKLVKDVIKDRDLVDEGYRIITNAGENGNQDVPHFHIHILGGKNLGRMIN